MFAFREDCGMKLFNLSAITIMAVLIIIVLPACSKGKSPVEPSMGNPEAPVAVAESNSNRTVLAVYDAMIDKDAKTFTVKPSNNRMADYHYPLTQLYPNVITITRYGFTPNFWADIKITHPLPNSGIDGFDPRVIAIIPANPGVSMNYPTFNVVGNNSVVLNPDAYTKLYDSLGGSIPGNTNPVLAYFKQVEYRRWFSSGTGFTSDTRRWDMDINGFGGPMQFKLVVDVSLNYPNPPQQIIDNAQEPVQIEAFVGNGLTPDGGSATVTVTLFDWQGQSGIKCKVECPGLFAGAIDLNYSHNGNMNEYVFSGEIPNELLEPPGEYPVLIAAWDILSDIHIFREASAIVRNVVFELVDVSPRWLSFVPSDIFIQGNYMYTSGSDLGLHVFDISDPVNPRWLNKADIPSPSPSFPENLVISGDYAYVSDHRDGLKIFDLSSPQSPQLVNNFQTDLGYRNFCVSGSYAYTMYDNSGSLRIYDIEPPEEAHVVGSFYTSGGTGVGVSGNYAYVGAGIYLDVIDVSEPDSPVFAYHINLQRESQWADIKISGNYAYLLANYYFGYFEIVDINQRRAVKILDMPLNCLEMYLESGYAYVVCSDGSLYVIDIDPPELANVVKTVDLPLESGGIYFSNGYAYTVSQASGITVIDVDPPESAEIVNNVPTLTGGELEVSDGYAYLGSSSYFTIVDTSPVELSHIVKKVDLSLPFIWDVKVSDGYGFVTNYDTNGLRIIDIDPPESAYIYKTFQIDDPMNIYISDSYFYLTNYDAGKNYLNIIDIHSLDSMHIVNSLQISGNPFVYEILEHNGYVYDANDGDGFKIVDVDPPESMNIVKTFAFPGSDHNIDVSGNYAYVTFFVYGQPTSGGVYIYDITVPESAYLLKLLSPPGEPWDIQISNGYAFVLNAAINGFHKLYIIDVRHPASAYIVQSVEIAGVSSLHIDDNYMYMSGFLGLSIFKLW